MSNRAADDANRELPASAAPPPLARAAAVAAIVVAGSCGGLIGYSVTDFSCRPSGCTPVALVIGMLSALGASIGVAIVSVLTLRAMGEWNATPPDQRRSRDTRRT